MIIFATPRKMIRNYFIKNERGRYHTKPELFRGMRITVNIEPIDELNHYHRLSVNSNKFNILCAIFNCMCESKGISIREKEELEKRNINTKKLATDIIQHFLGSETDESLMERLRQSLRFKCFW